MANFKAGEWVRITDAKGRRHNFALEAGGVFHTKKGQLFHDHIIGQPEGIVITSTLESQFVVFRPLLFETVVSMPRGAAIIYPKDAANIITFADIFPGAKVLEAGGGSGSLSAYLLRAIGPTGELHTFEIRDDFAQKATENIAHIFGNIPQHWKLTIGDLADCSETDFDRMILDLVNPWEFVELAANKLTPGGLVCAYVATTTQLSRFIETVRAHGGFTEPVAWEALERRWQAEGLAVRPVHGAGSHTAFLITSRKMAPGHEALVKTRRPAPGAYGPNYQGPKPRDLE